LTNKEIGIRTVVAITIDSGSSDVNIERLPVPVGTYNAREEILMLAGEEEETLDSLEALLRERSDTRAALVVRIRGDIQMLERDVNERLAGLRERYGSGYAHLVLRNETVSFRHLIEERSLVRKFIAGLKSMDDLDEETRARALELGLRAFDRAKGRVH
jgi:hypothetical protein